MILPIQQKINDNKEMLNKLLIFKNYDMPDEAKFVTRKNIEFLICEKILLEKYFKQENNEIFLKKMKDINYEILEYNEINCSEGLYLMAAKLCKSIQDLIEIDENYIIERV